MNLYWLGYALAKFILAIFFSRVEVVGKKNLEVEGPGVCFVFFCSSPCVSLPLSNNHASPVIFVGNHSNQFLDAGCLVATAGRPIGFLVADVSMKRPFIGHAARMLHAIPVVRGGKSICCMEEKGGAE